MGRNITNTTNLKILQEANKKRCRHCKKSKTEVIRVLDVPCKDASIVPSEWWCTNHKCFSGVRLKEIPSWKVK